MGKPEHYDWMLRYLRMLDPANAKILEGLGKHGPRNVLALARSIGLPPTTVSFRIKRLMKRGLLKIRTNLDYSKLGLTKAVLIAESEPGQERKLRQIINNLGYWTYLVRCYGKYDGYYSIFAFPAEHKKRLEEYLEKATQLEGLSRYLLFYTSNLTEVAPNFDWFDFKSKSWNFQWKGWIAEVQIASKEIPQRLMDPQSYSIRADKADILIMKELEKDGTARFTKLAKVANMTPQGVRYRYHKHIVGRALSTDYEVAILPYPLPISDMCSFVINFKREEELAKFVNSLRNKPFIFNYAKVIGKQALVVHTYTPKTEFSKFIDSMNRLTEQGLVQDFLYTNLDVASFKRQTISYEFFRKDRWMYAHNEKLKALDAIASKNA